MPPESEGLGVEASVTIDADRLDIWRALVEPSAIRE